MASIYYFFKNILIFITAIGCMLCGGNKGENIKYIAHSGLNTTHLENTMESFIAAKNSGYDGIETDIRLTKDGKFVCWHDGEVKYADGTVLNISESTCEQLTSKPIDNWTCDEVSYICPFTTYLDFCRENNLIVFLDFKCSMNDELVKNALDLVDEHYNLDNIIVAASDFETLIPFREANESITILLTYGRVSFEERYDYSPCFEYNIGLSADDEVISKEMVKEFHEKGLLVEIWTCNNTIQKNWAIALGVDMIESDGEL